MKQEVDAVDTKRDNEIEEQMKISQAESHFRKLVRFNTPKINIFLGIFVSIIQGGLMPMIGALMGKMLFVLMEIIDIKYMR